jgi:hypothetical protein
MPTYKVQLNFHDPNEGGWSEVYYKNATDTNTVLVPAITQLIANRVQLLAGQVRLDSYRYHDEGAPHSGAIFPAPANVNGFASIPSDYAFVAAENRLYASLSIWRPLYISGVPDVLWSGGPNFADPAASAWKTALDGYLAFLFSTGSPWLIKTFDPAAFQATVLGVLQITDDRLHFFTDFAGAYTPGTRVKITKVTRPSPRLGVVRILQPRTGDTPVGAGEFIVNGVLPRGFAFQGAGVVQDYTPLYSPITTGNFVRLRHRDRGRPFAEPHGRQRTGR